MQHTEGYSNSKSVGISVAVNFDAQKSLAELKEQLNETIKELSHEDIELRFSTGEIDKQLTLFGEKIDGIKTKMQEAFSGINFTGIDKLTSTLHELGDLDNKLKVSGFKELIEDLNNVDAGLSNFKEKTESIANSAESIGVNIASASEKINAVTAGMEKINTATKEATKSAKQLYNSYEKATIQVEKYADLIKSAKKDGASSETLANLKEEQKYWSSIAKTTMKQIQEYGLADEKLQKLIDSNKEYRQLQAQTQASLEKDEQIREKELATEQKSIDKINEKIALVKELTAEALEYKKALVSNRYGNDLSENKISDEANLKKLQASLRGRRNNSLMETSPEYQEAFANYDAQMQRLEEEARSKQLTADENEVKKLYAFKEKTLKQFMQVESEETKSMLASTLAETEKSIAKITSKYGADKQVNFNAMADANAYNEALISANAEYKELEEKQKTYIKNLRTIAQLKKDSIRSNDSDAQAIYQERIVQLEEQQNTLYDELSDTGRTIVSEVQETLDTQVEALRVKQEALEIAREEEAQEKARVQTEKTYLSLLAQEQKLRNEQSVAVTEEKRLQIEEKMTALATERNALYEEANEEVQNSLLAISDRFALEQKVEQAESSELIKIKEQETAYREILELQKERLRIETELEKTTTFDKANLLRLGGQHQDITSQIATKRLELNGAGLFSEEMEEANRSMLVASREMQNFNKAQANNSREMQINAQRIADYRSKLAEVVEVEGGAITKTKEYANAIERLTLAENSNDLAIQHMALGGMGTAMDELTRKVEKTDDAMHGLFESWKDFAGYTAVSMATTGILGSFDSAWENIKKINDAYTEVHKVYDPNMAGNNDMNPQNWVNIANKMGIKYGFSTADTLDAIYQAINYGYGKNANALAMAKSSMILSNTGKISESDASKYLISIMKGFYGDKAPTSQIAVDGKNENLIQSVIDKLSQGGMYFPITSGGIAEALMRGGSSMVGMGTSLEQAIQLIIAGNYSRQDPATVGNSMKSIYGSFVQLFTQNSKADIRHRKQLLGLTGNIYTNSKGELYNPYQILTNLAKVIKEKHLNKTQIGDIADILGGKTQLGVVYSLLTHLTGVESKFGKLNTNSYTQASGSAERENAKYMDSIQGKLNEMKEAVNAIWIKILKSQAIMTILSITTKVVQLVDFLIGKIGVINTLLGTTVLILSAKNPRFLSSIGKGIITRVTKTINAIRKLLGKDVWKKIPEEETNSDLKKAIKERERMLHDNKAVMEEIGLQNGEAYSNAVAEGIKNNSKLDEAVQEQNEKLKTNEATVGAEEILIDSEVASEEIAQSSKVEMAMDDFLATQIKTEDGMKNISEVLEEVSDKNITQVNELETAIDTTFDNFREQIELTEEEMNGLIAKYQELKEESLVSEPRITETRDNIQHRVGNNIEDEVGSDVEHGVGGLGEDVGSLAVDGLMGGVVGLGSIALISGLSYAIPKLISAYQNFQNRATTLTNEANETVNTHLTQLTKYQGQLNKLQEWEKQANGSSTNGAVLDSLNKQYQAGKLTSSQMTKYLSLVKQVAKISPELVDFKGANGNPYMNMENGLKTVSGTLKQVIAQQKMMLLGDQTIDKVWAGYNASREKINKQQQDFNDSGSSITSIQEEMSNLSGDKTEYNRFGMPIHTDIPKYTTQQVGSLENQALYNYQNAQQEATAYYQKLNKLAMDSIYKNWVKNHINDSYTTDGLTADQKSLYGQFMQNISLGGMSRSQVSDMMDSVDNVMNEKGSQGTKNRAILNNVIWTMKNLKKEYESSAISFKEYTAQYQAQAGRLEKIGVSVSVAESATQAKYFKNATTLEDNLYKSIYAGAEKSGESSKKIKSNLDSIVSAFFGFNNTIGKKGIIAHKDMMGSLRAIFTIDPAVGRQIATKMGISAQMPLEKAISIIGKNPALQKQMSIVMGEILNGKINPADIKKFQNEFSSAVQKAGVMVTGKDKITIPISVNGKNVEDKALKEGKQYKSVFTLSSTTGAKILNAVGLGAIAKEDGTKYKVGTQKYAKAVGQILHAKNILDISYKDGAVYAGGIRLKAKQVGRVLHALGVKNVSEGDGLIYADGVKMTAKEAGKVLNDLLAGTTAQEDANNYKAVIQRDAVGTATVKANQSEIQSDATQSAWSWKGFFEAGLNGGEGISKYWHTHSFKSLFFALPPIRIKPSLDLGHTKVTGHQALAQRLATSFAPYSGKGFASASRGGVSAGKVGKGGAVGSPVGAVSFATTGFAGSGFATPNSGSDMMAIGGTQEDGIISSLVPSNQEFAEAGANAGYSYIAGYTQISAHLMDEEATQYERLQNLAETYYDTDQSNLKLSIDLNQKLKNTLTDIGNAIAHNQALQSETENGYQTIDLMNQELDLLNQKKQVNEALEQSYQKQLQTMKSSLEQQGFTFGSNGSITNAVSKLQGLERWVNGMPDQIAKTTTKTYKKYTKTPYTYYKYGKGSYEDEPYHYYKNVGGHYEDESDSYWDYKLDKEVTKHWKKWVAGTEKEISGSYKKWIGGGKTQETGYKYTDTPETSTSTNMVDNKAKQDASQTVQNLQNLVNAYNNMLHDTVPQTVSSIDQINSQVQTVYNNMLSTASSVESQITQIIQKQISERKQAIENSANAEVNALNKTLTNLENKHNEQTYQTGLKAQYKQLQQIQEEINNAELDHSLTGQARLKELQKELQNQQTSINQTISDHEYQEAQNKINAQIKAIQTSSQNEQKQIDSTWTTQRIEQTVHQAMLTGKFKDVEGNIVSVKTVWVQFANEFDNGLGVMGNKLKDDFIKQLEEAQKIMENINTINKQMGYYNTSNATPKWVVPVQDSASFLAVAPVGFNHRQYSSEPQVTSPEVNFNAPLVQVQGSVNRVEDLHKFTKDLESRVTSQIVKSLRNKGAL